MERRWLVLALILAMFLSICALLIVKREKPARQAASVVSYSTNKPDETKPNKSYEWTGKPEDPKKILISSLGIDGYMQNVGVDQNKEVAVPNNIHVAGWFVESVRPGEKGLSIIDGHVDGRTQGGIFEDLAKIKPGAEVQIQFGNGAKKKFKVMKVEEVAEDKAASVLFSQSPKTTNQLNLITCSGDFNKNTERYEKRVIVSTELVPQS